MQTPECIVISKVASDICGEGEEERPWKYHEIRSTATTSIQTSCVVFPSIVGDENLRWARIKHQ